MRTTRTRRSLSRLVADADLGPVRRIHRQRRDLKLELVLGLTPGVAMIGGLVAVVSWRLALVLPAAAYLALLCWTRWAPIPGPAGRRWYAVCDGGLLIWSRRMPAHESIPWTSLKRPRRFVTAPARLSRISWMDGEEETSLDLVTVSARKSLVASIGARRPSRASVLPPSRAAVAGAGLLALALFSTMPWIITALYGEKPGSLTSFARMCFGGSSFGRAAAYNDQGPHPLVYFPPISRIPTSLPVDERGTAAAARDVQLVACSRANGRTSDKEVRYCSYEGGYSRVYFQGRYEVDVYEARTGRQVGHRTLVGNISTVDCPSRVYSSIDITGRHEEETYPEQDDYNTALSGFVTGPRRPAGGS